MPMIEARSRLLSGAFGGFLRAKNKITNANHDNNTTANASVGQKFKWMTIIVKPDSRAATSFIPNDLRLFVAVSPSAFHAPSEPQGKACMSSRPHLRACRHQLRQ